MRSFGKIVCLVVKHYWFDLKIHARTVQLRKKKNCALKPANIQRYLLYCQVFSYDMYDMHTRCEYEFL